MMLNETIVGKYVIEGLMLYLTHLVSVLKGMAMVRSRGKIMHKIHY